MKGLSNIVASILIVILVIIGSISILTAYYFAQFPPSYYQTVSNSFKESFFVTSGINGITVYNEGDITSKIVGILIIDPLTGQTVYVRDGLDWTVDPGERRTFTWESIGINQASLEPHWELRAVAENGQVSIVSPIFSVFHKSLPNGVFTTKILNLSSDDLGLYLFYSGAGDGPPIFASNLGQAINPYGIYINGTWFPLDFNAGVKNTTNVIITTNINLEYHGMMLHEIELDMSQQDVYNSVQLMTNQTDPFLNFILDNMIIINQTMVHEIEISLNGDEISEYEPGELTIGVVTLVITGNLEDGTPFYYVGSFNVIIVSGHMNRRLILIQPVNLFNTTVE